MEAGVFSIQDKPLGYPPRWSSDIIEAHSGSSFSVQFARTLEVAPRLVPQKGVQGTAPG